MITMRIRSIFSLLFVYLVLVALSYHFTESGQVLAQDQSANSAPAPAPSSTGDTAPAIAGNNGKGKGDQSATPPSAPPADTAPPAIAPSDIPASPPAPSVPPAAPSAPPAAVDSSAPPATPPPSAPPASGAPSNGGDDISVGLGDLPGPCFVRKAAENTDRIFLAFVGGVKKTRDRELGALRSAGVKATFFESGTTLCGDNLPELSSPTASTSCEAVADGSLADRSKMLIQTIAEGHLVGSFGHSAFFNTNTSKCSFTDTFLYPTKTPLCSDTTPVQNMVSGALEVATAIELYGDALGATDKQMAIENAYKYMSVPCANVWRISPSLKRDIQEQISEPKDIPIGIADTLASGKAPCFPDKISSPSVSIFGPSPGLIIDTKRLDSDDVCTLANAISVEFRRDTNAPVSANAVPFFYSEFGGFLTSDERQKKFVQVVQVLQKAGYLFDTLDQYVKDTPRTISSSSSSSSSLSFGVCKNKKRDVASGATLSSVLSVTRPTVFLTFTDGPGANRGDLLGLLKSEGIKASFYENGDQVCNITSASANSGVNKDYKCPWADDGGVTTQMHNLIRTIASGHFVTSHSHNGYLTESGSESSSTSSEISTSYSFSSRYYRSTACKDKSRAQNMVSGAADLESVVRRYSYALDSAYVQTAIDNFWMFSRLPDMPVWKLSPSTSALKSTYSSSALLQMAGKKEKEAEGDGAAAASSSSSSGEELKARAAVIKAMGDGAQSIACRPNRYQTESWDVHGYDIIIGNADKLSEADGECSAFASVLSQLRYNDNSGDTQRLRKVVLSIPEFALSGSSANKKGSAGLDSLRSLLRRLKDSGFAFGTMDQYFAAASSAARARERRLASPSSSTPSSPSTTKIGERYLAKRTCEACNVATIRFDDEDAERREQDDNKSSNKILGIFTEESLIIIGIAVAAILILAFVISFFARIIYKIQHRKSIVRHPSLLGGGAVPGVVMGGDDDLISQQKYRLVQASSGGMGGAIGAIRSSDSSSVSLNGTPLRKVSNPIPTSTPGVACSSANSFAHLLRGRLEQKEREQEEKEMHQREYDEREHELIRNGHETRRNMERAFKQQQHQPEVVYSSASPTSSPSGGFKLYMPEQENMSMNPPNYSVQPPSYTSQPPRYTPQPYLTPAEPSYGAVVRAIDMCSLIASQENILPHDRSPYKEPANLYSHQLQQPHASMSSSQAPPASPAAYLPVEPPVAAPQATDLQQPQPMGSQADTQRGAPQPPQQRKIVQDHLGMYTITEEDESTRDTEKRPSIMLYVAPLGQDSSSFTSPNRPQIGGGRVEGRPIRSNSNGSTTSNMSTNSTDTANICNARTMPGGRNITASNNNASFSTTKREGIRLV